ARFAAGVAGGRPAGASTGREDGQAWRFAPVSRFHSMDTTMRAESVPQLTPRAAILAIILSVILAAANTYLGLFAGMTIAAAIPAAVVSMAVLRFLGGGTILENNIVQTGASAGSSIASGVI